MTRRPHHDLDAAIEWLTAHPDHYLFPVEPLASTDPNHKPKSLKGYLHGKSTNSAEQLRGWWTDWWGYDKHLEPLWGISRTQSLLIFVDVDEKAATEDKPAKTGMKTFDWLDVLYGWPPTCETTSPSGGIHLLYDATEFGSIFHIGAPKSRHPYVDIAQLKPRKIHQRALGVAGGPLQRVGRANGRSGRALGAAGGRLLRVGRASGRLANASTTPPMWPI